MWNISADDFVEASTNTYTEDIPLDGATLDEFENLTSTERRAVVANVLDALPENLVAYRFGDYVFTYPGADLSAPDNLLWVVVMMPDPDVNGSVQSWQPITIGRADGTTLQFGASQMPGFLRVQNAHRASIGLPPLPDLLTVTHDVPAVATKIESED